MPHLEIILRKLKNKNMPRLQKITGKVFAEIAETPQKKGSYTTFLDIDSALGLPQGNQLLELKDQYKRIVSEQKKNITSLAALEEMIIQIRCKSVISRELRLSLSRNYIYARSLFYRRGNKINDIRVVIGTTKEYGTLLPELIKSPRFRSICISYLTTAMNREINQNKLKLESEV